MMTGNVARAVVLLLAGVAPVQATLAQTQSTLILPYGGTTPPPVPQNPVAPDDTPEEIAKDSARDLKDSRFYNKPGATRAQYDADWQRCRLIARGSRTPAGTVPMFYNPAYMSPVAAGVAGGLGGLIAGAIAEGQQRRENRRSCLLINGWRLVELPATEATRIAALTDDQRSSYFNTVVGAAEVPGTVTERTRFSLAPDANLHPDAPLVQPGTVFLGKKVDAAAPFVLAPGEAAVVMGWRRVEPSAVGRSGTVELARYDPAAHDLAYRPRDWKKRGDLTTYGTMVASHDKKASYEVQVLRLTPGDYVLKGLAVGKLPVTASHCFGAPTFHLAAGEVAYLGDFIPYMATPLAAGGKLDALAYASHPDDARRTLALRQPMLAAAMKPATLMNGATFACSGITMTRWDIDGLDTVPAPAPTVPVADAR